MAAPASIARVIRVILATSADPVAGLSVGVSQGSQLDFAGGFGLADVGQKVSTSAQTVYPISSMTKTFTAAAVMQLVQAGKLSLSDTVGSYVPGLPWGSEVTIAELLNHTSGIADYINTTPSMLGDDCPPPAGLSSGCARFGPSQVVKWLAGHPLLFIPGTKWSYSNSNYYLLGLVIQRVSGEPYLVYLDSHILGPLGLSHTGMCPDSPRPPELAVGYVPAPAPPPLWTSVGEGGVPASDGFAAGELCSTVGDLLKWSDALAHGEVVSSASYTQMTTPTRLANGNTVPYGFGMELNGFIGPFPGQPYVGHTGGQAGFSSVLMYFPTVNLNIVMLFNCTLEPGPDASLGIPNAIVTAVLDEIAPRT